MLRARATLPGGESLSAQSAKMGGNRLMGATRGKGSQGWKLEQLRKALPKTPYGVASQAERALYDAYRDALRARRLSNKKPPTSLAGPQAAAPKTGGE
jgi:hypothetical protein